MHHWLLVAIFSGLLLITPICHAESLGRGAPVPFQTHEGEDAETTGMVVRMQPLPGRDVNLPEIEASGRAYVRLDTQGEYCEFKAADAGNAMVLRYCLPDTPAGGGTTASISLYINDVLVKKLSLSSRHTWLYHSSDLSHGAQSNDPAGGGARLFWNESRFLLADHPWQAGDTLRLVKEADDTSEYYSIDLVDLEMVGKPLNPPKRSTYLSVVDFGATPNDDTDDTEAINKCIKQAQRQDKTVWIPPGRYFHSDQFKLEGVTVRGAGMWHTELIGTGDQLGFLLSGEKPRVADLYLESTIHTSRSQPGGKAFRSQGANEFAVVNVWMTHVHCGFWISHVTNGRIRGCRIYLTYADAINLNRVSCDNIVERNYIRGAGDDGIATLAELKDDQPSRNNTFRHNTVIANWWGHNIDVAGGTGHVVEDNLLADNSHSGCFTVNHPSAYPMHPLEGLVFRRNTLLRGGGNHAGQQRGAIWTLAGNSAIRNLRIEDNDILDSVFRAIHLNGSEEYDVVVWNNRIDGCPLSPVRVSPTVQGKLVLRNNSFAGFPSALPAVDNATKEAMKVVEGK